jgi:microcystin-dependent protein
MANPFLSEIRLFSFGFAPKGWALCDGQLLPINQNQALFSLLGTTYGGDGRVNFGLPDLQGRVPVHVGNFNNVISLGQRAGEETHTLQPSEMPQHTHVPVLGSANAPTASAPTGNLWATETTNPYSDTADSVMKPACVPSAGGSQAHLNMQPFLTLNFCIALQGIFPTQN